MKKIKLGGNKGKGLFAIIDDEDFERVSLKRWQLNAHDYVTNNGNILIHRLIMLPPRNLDIDHINHNTLDNRKVNLRIATPSQNRANGKKQKNNTSGYRGVSWSKCANSWLANISINHKTRYIGIFKSKKLAAMAYNKEAKKAFGEFSTLNQI